MDKKLHVFKVHKDISEYFKRISTSTTFSNVWRRVGHAQRATGVLSTTMPRRLLRGAQGLDADLGPYYPFVLLVHYFWRRGDICRACAFLEKARGRRLLHYDEDEKTAVELLKAAIREGTEGVRRVKTEDSHWTWASLFKDLFIAELDASARAVVL